MTDKFEVIKVGTDSSGRGIFMTRYMKAALDAVLNDWRVKPFADKIVVTQGAFMVRNGGGADASAGYHDQAGCIDFRIWNLTDEEAARFVFTARCYGFAAWRRIAKFGWTDEEHIHATLGGDQPYSDGARDSWLQYLSGLNGLASRGKDPERRPNPLVTSYTGPLAEDNELTPDDRDFIKNQFENLQQRLNAFRTGSADRDKKILAALEGVAGDLETLEGKVSDRATKAQLKKTRQSLTDQVAELKSFESSH